MSHNDHRPSNQAQLAALKTATRRAVRNIGKLEAAAHCTRVSVTRLSAAGSVQDDYFLPIDAVLDLELDTGLPVITETLARLQGYVLARAEDVTPESDKLDLLFETAVASRSMGDWSDTVIRALSDGRLSESEIEDLQEKASEQADRWDRRAKAIALYTAQLKARQG